MTYDSEGNRQVNRDTWSSGVQVEERWYRGTGRTLKSRGPDTVAL